MKEKRYDQGVFHLQNQQESIVLIRAHIIYSTYFSSGKNYMSASVNVEMKQKTFHTWGNHHIKKDELRTMESNKAETNLTVTNLVAR